jgi:UDP-2,3-diacylglucosamine hydrolase
LTLDDARNSSGADRPLAIICGGGSLPFTVADSVQRAGGRVVLFPVTGWADPELVERFPHHWFKIGQAGRFYRLARDAGCRDVVLIGSAVRPTISQIRVDWLGMRLLPRIARLFRGGDDHLLGGIGEIFEELGFRLLAPHMVAPEILVREGPVGRSRPSQRDELDIRRGFALIGAIGSFDIGQAVIVAENRVLAVEAAEGTDLMLERVAALRQDGRIGLPKGVGVLVKAPKPSQDRRVDLPSIGPRTVEGAARAGLAGIAVVAGAAVIAEPQRVADAADAAGLFVVGMRDEGTAS